MKRNLVVLSALAAGLALSTSAFALDINIDSGLNAGASVSTGGGGADASAGVTTGGGASIGAGNSGVVATPKAGATVGATAQNGSASTSVTSAINAFAATDAKLNAIKQVSASGQVKVVKLDTSASADASALAKARADKALDVTKLQAAINANTQLKAGLTASNIKVTDVVAADLAADGSLILYMVG